MVSNSMRSMKSTRYGASITTTPVGLSSCEKPSTTPLRSGTCASTLLAWMTSARLPSSTRRRASSSPKNSTSVGMPRSASATAAMLAAGSIPRTGTPASA